MDVRFAWLIQNRDGIFFLAELVVGLFFMVVGILWSFGLGRFERRKGAPGQANLRYLITEALTKIINDFRHLLALILVLIFGGALTFSLWQAAPNMADIKEALQAVSATLGGLVGSIIGYYFGESKGRSEILGTAPAAMVPQEVQQGANDLAIEDPIAPAQARPLDAEDNT